MSKTIEQPKVMYFWGTKMGVIDTYIWLYGIFYIVC